MDDKEKVDNDDLLSDCLEQIKKIESDKTLLDEQNLTAMQYYNKKLPAFDPDGNTSKYVAPEVCTVIESIIPSVMDVFASSNEVCLISSRSTNPEKVRKANFLNEKINYDLSIKNDWFGNIYKGVKDALNLPSGGWFKVWWVDEEIKDIQEYEGLTEKECELFENAQDTRILKKEKLNEQEVIDIFKKKQPDLPQEVLKNIDFYSIRTEKIVGSEGYAKFEPVPPEQLGFPRNTESLEKCRFFYHKVFKEEWEIREQFGEEIVKKIVQTKDNKGSQNAVTQERFADLGGVSFMYDDIQKGYWLYECYYNDKKTGQPMKTIICGDVFVQEPEENVYERIPFFTLVSSIVPHRLLGTSINEITQVYQDLISILIRSILDNFYYTNSPEKVINTNLLLGGQSISDILKSEPGKAILGQEGVVTWNYPPSISNMSIELLNIANTKKEEATGIFRSPASPLLTNQRTARGLQSLIAIGQQRIGLIIRLLGEGIKEMVKFAIALNRKFLKNRQLIILEDGTKGWLDPVDISDEFNVETTVGLGAGTKDLHITQLQQMLGLIIQIAKALGVNLATSENLYNIIKKIGEKMGYKDPTEFFTNPVNVQEKQQLFTDIIQAIQTGDKLTEINLLMQLAQKIGIETQQGGLEQQPSSNLPTQPELPLQPSNPADFFNIVNEMGIPQ